MRVTRSLWGAARLVVGGTAVVFAGTGPGWADVSDEAVRASAAESVPTSVDKPAMPPPQVDFDRLLRLPTSFDAGAGRYGGATATGWRARFRAARGAVDKAQLELDDAQARLQSTASGASQWQMGAPGLGNPDTEHSTVSHMLRAQMRDLRESLDAAEQQQRELVVEADLASVPQSWRGQVVQSTPEGPGGIGEPGV